VQELTIQRLEDILRKDSGITILRSRSAPFVLTFLFNTFYLNSISSLPYDEFSLSLENFLSINSDVEEELEEDILSENPEDSVLFSDRNISDRIRTYTENWLGEKKHYIRRYRNSEKTEIIELDSAVARLLPFIARILNSDTIATESSFNYILTQLKSLADNMNGDPEKRIEELDRQIRELEREREEIKRTHVVKTFDRRKTLEYLRDLENRGREILSDFAQVEDNFREIMNKIASAQAEVDSNRRKILGYSLTLHKELYASPQGQSFDGFWNYMMSYSDDRITELCGEIESLLKEQNIDYDDSFLLSLRKTFYSAGKRIVDKNSILTERMSRVMAQKTRSERRGFEELVASLRQESAVLRNNEKAQASIEMEIEMSPELLFPLSRTIRLENEESVTPVILFDDGSDSASVLSLKDEFYVDEKVLEENINAFFSETGRESFTLPELLERFPVEKGLEEIVAYITLAEKREKNAVSSEREERIFYSWKGKEYSVTLPEVRFYAE
jgi:hypothetical protein